MGGVPTVSAFDQATPVVSHTTDEKLTFDIAPQPLMTALRAYSEVTGQAVLVDDTLTAGRQSPGVQGRFDKVEALQLLLTGTGLVASYSTDQSFTLKLAVRTESTEISSSETFENSVGGGIEAVTESYAGKIQRPIEMALCQSDQTRLGTYRLALQLWIAPSGKIDQTRVLSANDDARANAVRKMLKQVVLDPPPSTMPQPLTLLLLPRNTANTPDCSARAQHRH